jgi:hypothetical protein
MKIRTTLAARFAAVGMIGLMLVGCGGAPAMSPAPAGAAPEAYESGVVDQTRAMPAAQATNAPAAPAAPGESQQQAQRERLIIRNADLTIIVKNTDEQLAALTKMAAQYGGFVVSSGTSKVGTETQGQITFRVDAKNFDVTLADIRKLAVDVRSENVRGEDVTAEYVDLEAQLGNLDAAEAQLQKIMEEATKTEDVLNVYARLTEIRGQIEQIKGRMKYLSQSAALSTINVTLIPDALAQPVEVGGWRVEGVVKNAVEALIAAVQGLVSIAIWLVIVALPILLVVLLPIVGLIWVIGRLQKRKVNAAKS